MQKRLIGSLLAISLLPMTTGVVASALPQLATAFPTASATTLNLVITVPSLAMMGLVLVSNVLVQRFGSKRLVLIGLGIVAVAAIMASLAPNLTWLLVARGLLGVGLGLYNALAVSLISRLFDGAQRQRLLGYQNATQGLGALLGALAVAGLLMLNWRFVFAIYLISVPILMAYAKNVPEVRFQTPTKSAVPLTHKQWRSLAYQTGLLFGLMTFYMLGNLKLPSLMVQRQLGSSSAGALLLVVMSFGTVVAGMSYPWLKRRCQQGVILLSIGMMLGGYGLLLMPQQRLALVGSAFLIGSSFGWFVPELFGTATQLVAPTQANFVTTILMTSSNLANFGASFALLLLAPTGSALQLIWHSLIVLFGLGLMTGAQCWVSQRLAPID